MFDPDPNGFHRRGWGGDEDEVGPNERHLIRFGLIAAFCLFFASFAAPPLVPLLLADLLYLSAIGTAVLAAVLGERIREQTLTHWDESLALLAASYGVGLFWPAALTGAAC